VSPKKTAISMRHVCRCFPPTVFATHLPTLSSISFCDVFADFILQQISLSNWNIGRCAPQEDSDLYNRDAVWTFKGSKRIIPSNQMKNFVFAICSASKGSHKVLLIQLHFCSLQKSSSPLSVSVIVAAIIFVVAVAAVIIHCCHHCHLLFVAVIVEFVNSDDDGKDKTSMAMAVEMEMEMMGRWRQWW